MNRYRRLLARAVECDQVAAECFDPGIREKLLGLASEFRDMAEREKPLQVGVQLATEVGGHRE